MNGEYQSERVDRTDLSEVASGEDVQTEGLEEMVINATVLVVMEDGLDINYEGGLLVPIEETSSNVEYVEEPNDLADVQVEEMVAIPYVCPEMSNAAEVFEHYEVDGPFKNDDFDHYDSGMDVLDLTEGKEPLIEDVLDLSFRKPTPFNGG